MPVEGRVGKLARVAIVGRLADGVADPLLQMLDELPHLRLGQHLLGLVLARGVGRRAGRPGRVEDALFGREAGHHGVVGGRRNAQAEFPSRCPA